VNIFFVAFARSKLYSGKQNSQSKVRPPPMSDSEASAVSGKICVKAAIVGDITVGKTTFISSLCDDPLSRT
jgi:GTPase SAR1 family protein